MDMMQERDYRQSLSIAVSRTAQYNLRTAQHNRTAQLLLAHPPPGTTPRRAPTSRHTAGPVPWPWDCSRHPGRAHPRWPPRQQPVAPRRFLRRASPYDDSTPRSDPASLPSAPCPCPRKNSKACCKPACSRSRCPTSTATCVLPPSPTPNAWNGYSPTGPRRPFAAAGTGEFFSLAPQEFGAVVQVAVEHCRGRTPIIAGAGAGGGTTLAIGYAQEAERLGAQGILLRPHYLTEASQEGLVAHVCERLMRDFFLPYIALRNQGQGYAVAIVKAGATWVGHGAGPVRPPLSPTSSPPKSRHCARCWCRWERNSNSNSPGRPCGGQRPAIRGRWPSR